jgi:hypothetical protein
VDRMANVARPRAAAARELEASVLGYALAVRTFTQTDDPTFPQEAANVAAAVERNLADYQKLAITERQQELADSSNTPNRQSVVGSGLSGRYQALQRNRFHAFLPLKLSSLPS